MDSDGYKDRCRLMSDETLRELATKAGSWGFYARRELDVRDERVAKEEN